MPTTESTSSGNAIVAIWQSEKGLLTVLLLIAATVLAGLGRMTIDQWTSFAEIVFGAYVLGKTATSVGISFANRPRVTDSGSTSAVGGNTTNVIAVPPSTPAPDAGGGLSTTALVLGLVIAMLSLGCTAADRRAIADNAIDCTKGAAASVVKQFAPTLDALLVSSIGGDGKVDRAELKEATRGFAKDVGMCVLADVVARALKPAPTDPNAPRSSPVEADRADLRAAFDELRAELGGNATYTTAGGTL